MHKRQQLLLCICRYTRMYFHATYYTLFYKYECQHVIGNCVVYLFVYNTFHYQFNSEMRMRKKRVCFFTICRSLSFLSFRLFGSCVCQCMRFLIVSVGVFAKVRATKIRNISICYVSAWLMLAWGQYQRLHTFIWFRFIFFYFISLCLCFNFNRCRKLSLSPIALNSLFLCVPKIFFFSCVWRVCGESARTPSAKR